MEHFLSLVTSNGVTGLVTGLTVLIAVFGLNYAGVAVTKGQKQSANVVLSLLLAGVNLLNPSAPDVVVAGIASVGSALAYEFIRHLGKQAEIRKNEAKAQEKPVLTPPSAGNPTGR